MNQVSEKTIYILVSNRIKQKCIQAMQFYCSNWTGAG